MSFAFRFLLLFLCCVPAFGQWVTREISEVSATDHGLEITVNDGKYHIGFISEGIVQTAFVPLGMALMESHAVQIPASGIGAHFRDENEQLRYSFGPMEVRIGKKPFKINYYYNGNWLTSEKSPHQTTAEKQQLSFSINADEALYGGGARVLGLNRRGNKLELYNRAHYGYETRSELMNYTMPLVLSSRKYAIHFDHPGAGFLDLDSAKNNEIRYETLSGALRYQVAGAQTWPELIDRYTHLTGKQPLPPRWIFGNFASRFGYHSSAETRKVIDAFEKHDIPLDAVILDLYWFGKEIKGTMGNLEVYRDSFPDFEQMIADFRRKQIRTIPITEPFILTTSSKWNEAVAADILAKKPDGTPYTYDFYFGNTGLIDVFKPEARNWFWNIYKSLAEKGAGGVWGDLGEPEVHPDDLLHANGPARLVHNIYGHEWAKLVFEGYQRDFPHERPFILMRSGYSGSQRYGIIPWSGDVNRTWGGFSGQAEISLGMGLQGLAYMHSDLGGFAGDNPDEELYVRWLQMGVFNPVFRPHAQQEVPPEPVFKSAPTRELAKKAIELRYALLPYIYSLAFENNQTGMPLMRPMFFESETATLHAETSAYLFGPNVLVSPVLESGLQQQKVIFPGGSNWFDFYTGKMYAANSQADVVLSADRIPTFVRGNAVVPMAPNLKRASAYEPEGFELHFYPDVASPARTFTWYQDDGITPDAFEKGQYQILECNASANFIELYDRRGPSVPLKIYRGELVVHKTSDKKYYILNGKKHRLKFDKRTKTARIPLQWGAGTLYKIEFL